jgi:hypothetical protein
MKRVCWPLNFKASGIEKYDGSTNRAEWREVYELTIEAAGGDYLVFFSLARIGWSRSCVPVLR